MCLLPATLFISSFTSFFSLRREISAFLSSSFCFSSSSFCVRYRLASSSARVFPYRAYWFTSNRKHCRVHVSFGVDLWLANFPLQAFPLLNNQDQEKPDVTYLLIFSSGREQQPHFPSYNFYVGKGRLTGGVSLDGSLLFSFFRVSAGEGGMTSYCSCSAFNIALL